LRRAVPEVYEKFRQIRQALGTPAGARVTAQVYPTMPAVNFCSGVCEPLAAELRVLPVSDIGWSAWGTAERIWATVRQLGKQAEFSARLNRRRGCWKPSSLGA